MKVKRKHVRNALEISFFFCFLYFLWHAAIFVVLLIINRYTRKFLKLYELGLVKSSLYDFALVFLCLQPINFESPKGGISLITEKGPVTSSRLLIQKAIEKDSGLYTCSPNNTHPNSVRVHIVDGKFRVVCSSPDRLNGTIEWINRFIRKREYYYVYSFCRSVTTYEQTGHKRVS